jgi:hypothetical protein
VKGLIISFQSDAKSIEGEQAFACAVQAKINELAGQFKITIANCRVVEATPMPQPTTGAPLDNTRVAKGSTRPTTADEY